MTLCNRNRKPSPRRQRHLRSLCHPDMANNDRFFAPQVTISRRDSVIDRRRRRRPNSSEIETEDSSLRNANLVEFVRFGSKLAKSSVGFHFRFLLALARRGGPRASWVWSGVGLPSGSTHLVLAVVRISSRPGVLSLSFFKATLSTWPPPPPRAVVVGLGPTWTGELDRGEQ